MTKKNYISTDGDGNIVLQDINGRDININDISAIKTVFENTEPDYIKQLHTQIDENYNDLLNENKKQTEIIITLLKEQISKQNIEIKESKNILTGTISDVRGDVHIGDIITYNTLPAEKRSKIDQQIYLKCNRENIVQDLEDILEDMDDDEIKKPQIIFIPGYLDDKHSFAVKKLEYSILEEYENPIVNLTLLDWDVSLDKKTQIRRLKRNVLKVVKKYIKEKGIKDTLLRKLENAAPILQQAVTKEYILTFEQEIDLDDWGKYTKESLEWYINDFWNIEIDELAKPVFVFINIVYGKKISLSDKQISNILAEIKELIKNNKLNNLDKISTLNSINRGHIENFLDYYEIYDAQNFIAEGETHRMAKVLPQLRSIVTERDIKADDEAIMNL